MTEVREQTHLVWSARTIEWLDHFWKTFYIFWTPKLEFLNEHDYISALTYCLWVRTFQFRVVENRSKDWALASPEFYHPYTAWIPEHHWENPLSTELGESSKHFHMWPMSSQPPNHFILELKIPGCPILNCSDKAFTSDAHKAFKIDCDSEWNSGQHYDQSFWYSKFLEMLSEQH